MEYPRGWPAIAALEVTRARLLPGEPGTVQVRLGEQVQPTTIVALGSTPLMAGMRGQVVRVIPRRGVVITGAATVIGALAGWGPIVTGPLAFLAEQAYVPGTILVVPGQLTQAIAQRAMDAGVTGIIAASVTSAIASALAGEEISAILDGTAEPANRQMAVAVVHGFGDWLMDDALLPLLGARVGQVALLDPATNIPRGQRPEIVIGLPAGTIMETSQPAYILAEGGMVWIKNGRSVGMRGRIQAILGRSAIVPSGIRARCARVRLENGQEELVPLVNLQGIL